MKIYLCLVLTVVGTLAAPAIDNQKRIVPILKQINQLNDDGSYTFGYEGGDGSFRVETKDINGFTKGRYGYIDTEGKSRVLEYVAGKESGSSIGFVPSGSLVPVPIVRSVPTAEQRVLDYQYSSVDANEDGIPDNKASLPLRVILTPTQKLPAVQQNQVVSQQIAIPQQQQQQFIQPTIIRTSPTVILRQQQQQQQPVIRQQAFINQQDLRFQTVDVDQDGIPDQFIPADFPIFGGRII